MLAEVWVAACLHMCLGSLAKVNKWGNRCAKTSVGSRDSLELTGLREGLFSSSSVNPESLRAKQRAAVCVPINQRQVCHAKSKLQQPGLCCHRADSDTAYTYGNHRSWKATSFSWAIQLLDKNPLQQFLFPMVNGHAELTSNFRFSLFMMMIIMIMMMVAIHLLLRQSLSM